MIIIKRFLLLITIFLTVSSLYQPKIAKAEGENVDSIVEEELSKIDLEELRSFYLELSPDLDLKDVLIKIIKGEYDFRYDSFFSYVIKILFQKINGFLPDIFLIVAIALILSILKSGRGFVLSDELSKVTSFIFVFIIGFIILKDIYKCFEITGNTIQNLSKLVEIMSPIIITLSLTTGGFNGANFFKPTTVIASGGFSVLISSVVFPLVILLFTFSFLDALSQDFDFSGFSSSVTGLLKFVLGLLVTVFGIYSVVFGVVGRNIDGVSVKITKYLISSSVPIVGNMVKDGLDVIMLGCLLIKNALGLVSVIGILFIILSPLVFNLTLLLLFKLCSGFCGLFGENGTGKLINGACTGLKYLNIALITSSFITLTSVLSVCLSVGNAL